ncbi:ATP-dependent DNA helicase pif1 [Eumeta japonica]|uniref:ATP-dependent DNA helicase n=1 Tax=Eumeta variegata TaxID=151549 RepID=A0A4C1VXH3_EUMVA|nr:ATP-dependent DNA helicase pif1 [Eumeta japonica]
MPSLPNGLSPFRADSREAAPFGHKGEGSGLAIHAMERHFANTPQRMRASPEQFSALVDFMERYDGLSRPQPGAQGRLKDDWLWQELTNLLNSMGGGRHASGTGGGPSSRQLLTALEKRIVAVMGVSAAAGQAGIKEHRFNERQARLRATETSAQRESRLSSQRSQTEATRIRKSMEQREARLFTDREAHALSPNARSQETPEERKHVSLPIVKLMHYRLIESDTTMPEFLKVKMNIDKDYKQLENYELIRLSEENYLLAERERVREIRHEETVDQRQSRLNADRLQHTVSRMLSSSIEDPENGAEIDILPWVTKEKSGYLYLPRIDYSEFASIGGMEICCQFCHALKWRKEPNGICCSGGKVLIENFHELPDFIKALLNVNPYVRSFKAAIDSIPQGQNNNYKVIIKADRRPAEEHRGRYNAPVVDEVAVILVDQECDRRDIVLRSHDDRLQRICETHRSYDALQYPLIYFHETERLIYIRTNQTRLRAEDYVHLRDAMQQDNNVENVGRLVILPSSFIGGPRYMHERTQDAFCYVRKYGRPDLFITFTTNPKWNEISQELCPVSAELPDKTEDPILFDIVKTHMIHGPCGTLNRNSPCMQEGHCSKRYPRALSEQTISGENGYPLYRRKSPQHGGFTAKIRLRGQEIDLDNRWVVPYSPVLSRTFQAHINVEVCNSVQSIKYICKYVNKGSDQATVGFTNNNNDEVTRFQSGFTWCIRITPNAFTCAYFLLDGDQHWDDALAEASISESPQRLRNLFAVMLVFCALSDAALLWHKYQNKLAEDFFRDYAMEINYDPVGLAEIVQTDVPRLTEEQRLIFNRVRGQGKIALAVASSGIAATLLPGGKTAHTMFKIPIDLDRTENPVCNISRNSNKAKVLRDCSLIVWDECTMANRKAIEALDRTLRDIKQNGQTMGGITILFCGDFRQTLPVIPRGTRADEVRACLKSSRLWQYIIPLHLTVNMRAQIGGNENAQEFSDLLLEIGNGVYPQEHGNVVLNENLCCKVSSMRDLISSVYGNATQIPTCENSWLCERAILTPRNDQAAAINSEILSFVPGDNVEYISINRVMEDEESTSYPVEF